MQRGMVRTKLGKTNESYQLIKLFLARSYATSWRKGKGFQRIWWATGGAVTKNDRQNVGNSWLLMERRMERETAFEPATSTLARLRSTS